MFNYEKYLRVNKLPHIWCPGCGHGIIMKSLIRAIDKTNWSRSEMVVVSGIGCASRLPGYMDTNTLHTAHGRALSFATGIKLAKPNMKVIVVSGDGDALAIGGNHFIHACRRNIDITLIVFNNNIYGMTGGQYSPTTPACDKTATSPHGNMEPKFDVAKIAIGAGATYVARGTTYHVPQLDNLIYKGFMHKGFAVIDVIEACLTTYGRKNKEKFRTNADMLRYQKENSVPFAKAKEMSEEELEDKFVTGVIYQKQREEFCEKYQKIIDNLHGAKQ